MGQLLWLVGALLLLLHCRASCVLQTSDWTTIQQAYLQRNTYEPLREFCNASLPSSFHAKYGNCATPLGTILTDQNLVQNCTQYFESTLYNGKGAKPAALATALCTSNPFSAVVRNNLCNPGSLVGCPSAVDGANFAVLVVCNGNQLINKTLAQQQAYYANKEDVACMVRNKVCTNFEAKGWNTCPLNVSDLFRVLDVSGELYTCDSVFPSAQDRCNMRFYEVVQTYCPLPTWEEQNLAAIVVSSVLGALLVVVGVVLGLRHRRRTHLHHITSGEVLQNVDFERPHPELIAVIEKSKFKNVTYDRKTHLWTVAGDPKQFASEVEAARRAYINLAKKSVPDVRFALPPLAH